MVNKESWLCGNFYCFINKF